MLDAAEGTHGRCIVKLMGDGALVALHSVVAAVDRAMAIQKSTAKGEAPRADVARIPLRIGVDRGDVIIAGDHLYGEVIDVAAQPQALAPIGGVALSATVAIMVAAESGESIFGVRP